MEVIEEFEYEGLAEATSLPVSAVVRPNAGVLNGGCR
jgi:hypothetical protein